VKTDELIRALAADARARPPSLGVASALGLAAGGAVTASTFFIVIGFRPDISQALETIRFLFKFVVALSIVLPAVVLSLGQARPGARLAAWGWALALAPALLLLGVVVELVSTPPMSWGGRLVGTNMPFCLTFIPLLSIGPLTGLMLTQRYGAPDRPRLAGALAGLAAGGVAALFYASTCTDDSPLFVATWYTLAIGLVAMVGHFLAPKLLRW
jgi:hypothetical protein